MGWARFATWTTVRIDSEHGRTTAEIFFGDIHDDYTERQYLLTSCCLNSTEVQVPVESLEDPVLYLDAAIYEVDKRPQLFAHRE